VHTDGLLHSCGRWQRRGLPCPFEIFDGQDGDTKEEEWEPVSGVIGLPPDVTDVMVAADIPLQLRVTARGLSFSEIREQMRGLVEDSNVLSRPLSEGIERVQRPQTGQSSVPMSSIPGLLSIPSGGLGKATASAVRMGGAIESALAQELQQAAQRTKSSTKSMAAEEEVANFGLQVGNVSIAEEVGVIDARGIPLPGAEGESLQGVLGLAMVVAFITTFLHARSVINSPLTNALRMERFVGQGGLLFPGAKRGGFAGFFNAAERLRAARTGSR